jgi:hypothetical protein
LVMQDTEGLNMQKNESGYTLKGERDKRQDTTENAERISEGNRLERLRILRTPFPENQISHLPKGGAQLSYVGHAALTDRLLDADPQWTWEPLAYTAEGLPRFDDAGGLWIKLTVCGVTRLGYGNAAKKPGPGDREKEVIGDCLRNAAMRFGAALDLWHKGELHAHQEEQGSSKLAEYVEKATTLVPRSDADSSASAGAAPEDIAIALLASFDTAKTEADVEAAIEAIKKAWPTIRGVQHITESFAAMRKNARLRIKGS